MSAISNKLHNSESTKCIFSKGYCRKLKKEYRSHLEIVDLKVIINDLENYFPRLTKSIIEISSMGNKQIWFGGKFNISCLNGESPNGINVYSTSEHNLNILSDIYCSRIPKYKRYSINRGLIIKTIKSKVSLLLNNTYLDTQSEINISGSPTPESAIWYTGDTWQSSCSPSFYLDIREYRSNYGSKY